MHNMSKKNKGFPVHYSEEEWRARLPVEAFAVLRQDQTEPPGSSPLNHEKRPGIYRCAGCGQAVFSAADKYESGSGWPSFWRPLSDDAVETETDFKLLYPRTEIHCSRCGSHFGHVFEDGPEPTGLRYCLNGTALDFKPEE